jgi:hypothetical protein
LPEGDEWDVQHVRGVDRGDCAGPARTYDCADIFEPVVLQHDAKPCSKLFLADDADVGTIWLVILRIDHFCVFDDHVRSE